ncbi:MAG: gamma-glutamyltransferase, partial [Ignavibacteria bacterium]|nr:gamma-glutamyltransferase [Ignavibacteria bacterium]
RMLSSMTPTIVLKDNKPYIALGSPGGGKIITTVLQTIVNIIDYGYSLQKAIDLPRFHHQWYPDLIMAENDMLNKEKVKFLKKMGYDIKTVNDFGRVDAIIFYSDGTMEGHSDRRGYGISMGF